MPYLRSDYGIGSRKCQRTGTRRFILLYSIRSFPFVSSFGCHYMLAGEQDILKGGPVPEKILFISKIYYRYKPGTAP
jgi:hypothetical protein